MKDIEKIEIKIINLVQPMELYIIPSELKVFYKNKSKDINFNVIENILNIVCLWDYKYLNNNIIDGNRYEINIYTTKGVDRYIGINSYPKGYDKLVKMVGELYE